jgi:hypothetical protein
MVPDLLRRRGETCPLPIEDADSDGPPILRGVNLSPGTLERIYWRTPLRMLGSG